MKKTLLATAIAGALGASAAAQAATVYNQDGTQLDIYGNIQLAYSSVETLQDDGSVEADDQIADNGTTFGFAAQHIINDGLTGYLKLEIDDIAADEIKTGPRQGGGDQAYIGLKGNFGDARVGSWDALIDDWVQDPITNNEFDDVSDSNGLIVDGYGTTDREGDKVQYMSPSFGGLQFAVGTQYKGDGEGEMRDAVEAEGRASFFGGLKYTVGAFSIAGVYDDLAIYDGEFNSAADLNDDGTDDVAAGDDFDAGDQYGVTAQYTMGMLRVALKYERYESEDELVQADTNFYGLGARYGYGNGDIYAAYQYVDVGGSNLEETIEEDDENIGENDDSRNEILAGVSYNISPAMYVWLEGGVRDQEDDLGNFTATGIVYSF